MHVYRSLFLAILKLCRLVLLHMITDQGDSTSNVRGIESAQSNFNKFALSENLPSFEEMTAEQFENNELFFKYSYWLVFTYTTNKDENLMWRTCDSYIRRLMNAGQKKFVHPNRTTTFYDGLDDKSPGNKSHWYHKLMANVRMNCARRAIELGESITESAPCLSRSIFISMAEELFRNYDFWVDFCLCSYFLLAAEQEKLHCPLGISHRGIP